MQEHLSKPCGCGHKMFATGLRTVRGGRMGTEEAWVCSNPGCRRLEAVPRWSEYWSARYQQSAGSR